MFTGSPAVNSGRTFYFNGLVDAEYEMNGVYHTMYDSPSPYVAQSHNFTLITQ